VILALQYFIFYNIVVVVLAIVVLSLYGCNFSGDKTTKTYATL